VEWWWGPSGAGKTYKAKEEYPDACWLSGDWNGYEGETVVVIDELRKPWFKPEDMIKAIDGTPMLCRILYGGVPAEWTKIIITTNLPPNRWLEAYIDDPSLVGPLERRLLGTQAGSPIGGDVELKCKVVEFKGVYTKPDEFAGLSFGV